MNRRSTRRGLRFACAVLVVVLALAGVAVAAKPKTGTYGGQDLSLQVKGGKIVDVTGGAGYKCNAIPIELKKKLSVSKAGKFHYSGKVDKVTGDPAGTLVLKGKFKTRKKAAGSYKYVDSDGCTHQAKFTAVLGKSAV